MPTNSWGMGLAQGVGLGTTGPTTATVDGSVLGAGTQVGEHNLDSFLNEQIAQMEMNQLHHQAMQAQISAQSAWNTSQNTQSLSQLLSELGSSFHTTSTNSFMNTKTKKETLPAYKPVTLTLTGQLKPSTLTGVPQVKSARSTKPKKVSTLVGW